MIGRGSLPASFSACRRGALGCRSEACLRSIVNEDALCLMHCAVTTCVSRASLVPGYV
ncbi:hypothetical protein C4K40_5449 [Pseudomonas sp. CMR5c]|nr:hypothetical protein C4K40_5449 [Pseudomonas sp. CMR5c]